MQSTVYFQPIIRNQQPAQACPSPVECASVSQPAPYVSGIELRPDRPQVYGWPRPYQTQQLVQPQPVFTDAATTTSSQSQAFVDAHNNFRNNTRPPATNMRPIQWSNSLAEGAQDWASKCRWGHSQTPRVGENLYATSRRTPNPSSFNPSEAVNNWGNEQIYYDYDRNKCDPGKTCGHYTQVVWADTDRVGCAVQDCPRIEGLNFPGGGTIVVCQYSPPGNYVGQKPYQTR